jgi:hypothetical protein
MAIQLNPSDRSTDESTDFIETTLDMNEKRNII